MAETVVHLLLCDSPDLALEESLPLLRDQGFLCTYVQDADEVCAVDGRPDAVLVSAQISGGPHGEVFDRLLRTFHGVPLLVVARIRSLSTAIDFFRSGAADYLAMPLDAGEMRERIAAALSRGMVEDAAPVEVAVEPSQTPQTPGEAVTGAIRLQSVPCGILIFDAGGSLLQANAAALSLLGQTSVDGLALTLREHVEEWDPRDSQGRPLAPEAWLPRRVLHDKTARSATVSLRRPNRTRVWLRLDAAPRIQDGRISDIAMTLINITDECSEIRRLRTKIAGCALPTA